MTFEELGLRSELTRAVEDLGFESPSPIQEQAIPYLLSERNDFIGLAQTGTGKTAAFGLPLLNKIDGNSLFAHGLIICPTRELCLQITKDLQKFSKFLNGMETAAIYGGANIRGQIEEIKRGVSVIVGTPGRLVDLIKRKVIKLKEIEIVILDEADEMLNMGFKEDLDFILDATPHEKSTWLFSATMPREVERIAFKYMNDPYEVHIGNRNEANENIDHTYFIVKEKDRFDALKRLIGFNPDMFGLVFCRTRRETQQIAERLDREGFKVEALHGDLPQNQRDRVMKRFRNRTIQLLVATDVASRGIDVRNITHVINYQLPDELESYTHRSGRTARAGKKGESWVLINVKEQYKIKRIEKIIGQRFHLGKIPSLNDIREAQFGLFANEILDIEVDTEKVLPYVDPVMERLEGLTKEDIVQRLITKRLEDFSFKEDFSEDLNVHPGVKGARREASGKGESRRASRDQQRFFVSIGKKEGLNPGGLLRLICDKTGLESNAIGKIDILNSFSFFNVDTDYSGVVLSGLSGAKYEKTKFSIEPADQKEVEKRSFRKRERPFPKNNKKKLRRRY